MDTRTLPGDAPRIISLEPHGKTNPKPPILREMPDCPHPRLWQITACNAPRIILACTPQQNEAKVAQPGRDDRPRGPAVPGTTPPGMMRRASPAPIAAPWAERTQGPAGLSREGGRLRLARTPEI